MNNKKIFFILLFVFLLVLNLYSQNKDIDKIPINFKKPVKVCGTEADELQFYQPSFVRYNKTDKKVYVCDTGNNRIVVLDDDLNFITHFGRKGQGPGEFNNPVSIDFFNSGNLVILDKDNYRIQIFDKNYKYVSGFSGLNFNIRPVMDCDSEERIYFDNFEFPPVSGKILSAYNRQGKLIKKFGENFGVWKKPMVHNVSNEIRFCIDENNIFCVFRHHPVLRKYSQNFELLLEKKLDNLPEIRSALEGWEEKKQKEYKYIKNANISDEAKQVSFEISDINKRLIKDIYSDTTFLYLIFEKNTILAFDIKALKLQRRIKFQGKSGREKHNISKIDVTSPKYFYALDRRNMLVLKFEK